MMMTRTHTQVYNNQPPTCKNLVMFNIRPLGLSLSASEKESFDKIRAQIDRCTNEIMVRPDWGENLTCVDLVNSAPTQAT
jgi:hypothetical protein